MKASNKCSYLIITRHNLYIIDIIYQKVHAASILCEVPLEALIVGCWLLVCIVGCWLSVVEVGCWFLVVDSRFFSFFFLVFVVIDVMVAGWQLVICGWMLKVSGWLLVVIGWLLGVGCWLLVLGCW